MTNRETSRTSRHDAIRALIEKETLTRQDQFVTKLKAQGFDVTQSSISRDLAQMNVNKLGGRYVLPKTADGAITEIKEFWSAGDHMVIIKTEPAEASLVAKKLDNLEYRHYIASVAGDDTVFVACHSSDKKRQLLEDLQKFHAAARS